MGNFVAISKMSMIKPDEIRAFSIVETQPANGQFPAVYKVVFVVGLAKMSSDSMTGIETVKEYLKKIVHVKI